jgi:excisionase family DNA binding protein
VTLQAVYSPMQLARLTGISKSTIYRWVESGELVSVEIGGRRFVPLAALQKHYLIAKSIELIHKVAALAPS